MTKRAQEAWWIGSEDELVDKRVEVVWNRDVGKLYSGQVVEFNAAVKRHRVAFDDGDERWFRMERKIFSTEVNGKKVTYRGEMKVRRDAAVAGAGLAGMRSPGEGSAASPQGKHEGKAPAAAEAPASKPKPKPKKAKKIDKSIINRAYMTGTLTTTGGTSVIEGWWDESKKVVQDPAKRDPQKTFQLTKANEASLIPPHEDTPQAEGSSDSDEEDYFSGGNCVGWFTAMTAGDSSYDAFDDDLELHLKLDDGSDAEAEAGEEYAVRGMGCNSGGTYRVSGSAVSGKVALLREYISEEYFEEEKAKFNKFVSGDGDRDESLVEFTLGAKRFLVSEDEPIKFLQSNPRPPDTMVYLKYDQYKKAATIADALDKKCNRSLLRDHFTKGWLAFPNAEKGKKLPPSAVEQEPS